MIGTFSTIAIIATGGAFGAVSRYGINTGVAHLLGKGFPYGTMIVNILGSFLMGVFIAKFIAIQSIPHDLRALYMTGFLGAFTTFSTFSLDIVLLWQRGEVLMAAIYMFGTVIMSIAALAFGLWLMRGSGI